MHPQEQLFRSCLATIDSLAARVESNERRPSADHITSVLRGVHAQLTSLLPPPDDEDVQAPARPAYTALDPSEPIVLPSTDQNGQATAATEDAAHGEETTSAEGADGGQPVDAAGHVSRSEEA
jgi:hypothetical protein